MRFFSFFTLFFVFALSASARPNLPKPYLVAPVFIDGQNQTQIWIFPREAPKQFAIEAEPLMQALNPVIKSEPLSYLQKRKSPAGTISLHDLRTAGLSVAYSEATLEIRIDVPMKLRRSASLDLVSNDYEAKTFLRPSSHSGYLNLRSNQSYQYGEDNNTDHQLPFTGSLDFVENIQGFAFESGADYTEFNEAPWRRKDTRLVWDSEEEMVRVTAGDNTPHPKGFQSSIPLGGLGVAREFSIQPYRTAKPLGNSELFIKRPSLVEVYINGSLFSQIRLNPGRFNIKDFPITNGQNNVKVKIKDDLGQEEVFDFSVLYENTILISGLHEFGYYLGKPWRESGGDRAYDSQNNMGTLYHRYGFTDTVTGGVNFQAYQGQSLVGAELSLLTPFGFLTFDAGHSSSSLEERGAGGKLRYRTLDRVSGSDARTAFTLELEKRDLHFRPISLTPTALNNYENRIDGQISSQISDHLYFGLGGGYQQSSLSEDLRTYRANLIIPFTTRFRVEGSYTESVNSQRESQYLVSLYWVDTPGIYSISSYYASQNNTTNVNLSRNNIKRYDDARLNASYQKSTNLEAINLNADYLSQPAIFRFENYSSKTDISRFNVATVGINTGIAWVGSEFSFTQPIQDSFALVSTNMLPKDQELKINPTNDYADAQLGPRKTTVLNQYAAYYKYMINLDSTSLPMGYLLNKEFYAIHPTYKSGILIPINLVSRIMVKGSIVRPDQTPIPYIVGDIYNDKNQLVDNNFFTNKDGVFIIEGLEPGRYTIKTDKPRMGVVTLDVVQTENNFLKIAPLVATESDGENP